MKAFIEYVVKALVDFPNEVDVREVEGDRRVVYELRLNKSDVGKIIGKQGRTIQSLRTLVNNASIKAGKRAALEIIEDQPFVKPGQPTEVTASIVESSQLSESSQTTPAESSTNE